jgi:hypothetical protein
VRSAPDRSRCAVLLVGHVLAPVGSGTISIGVLQREVHHRALGRRAVPVTLTGFEAHDRSELLGAAAGRPDTAGGPHGISRTVIRFVAPGSPV